MRTLTQKERDYMSDQAIAAETRRANMYKAQRNELLAALRTAADAYEHAIIADERYGIVHDRTYATLADMRAAIAKAEG